MARWVVAVTLELDAPTPDDAWTKANSIMNRDCHGDTGGAGVDDEHSVITWQIDEPESTDEDT